MPKTFFMLAGEASGDAHAARLIEQLKSIEPGTRVLGLGGPKMAAAGFETLKDLSGMQVVGFWEVAKQYGFFRRVFFDLLAHLKSTRPDALICIDYPGFNLRFAAEAKKLGIPVLYYIVPQVWAWKPQRAKTMAAIVDRAFCVFDFEAPFFEKFGLKTTFVGHPLIDGADCSEQIATARQAIKSVAPGAAIVGFLPGSRHGEVRHHLNIMARSFELVLRERGSAAVGLVSLPKNIALPVFDGMSIARAESTGEREIAILHSRADSRWAQATRNLNAIQVSHARLLCGAADFSVVKSGTSTLEAGLGGQPLCVIYRGSTASYAIARILVNIPVFSLVNIVLGKYAVPELLQWEVNPRRLADEISRGLSDADYRAAQTAQLALLPAKLGGSGASRRAAQHILDFAANR